MKIRTGFVSNSSSTSFVVALPQIDEVRSEVGKHVDHDLEAELNTQLYALYSSEHLLWAEGNDYDVFEALCEYFRENDLVLLLIDGSSEELRIIGIDPVELQEKLKRFST